MNYCCARGDCDGCWQHWSRHARIRYPVATPRREPYPVVNQDTGDEDDGLHYHGVAYHRDRNGVWHPR